MSEETKDQSGENSALPKAGGADPRIILQELEKSAAATQPQASVENSAPADKPAEAGKPLVTESMRRLDELLARFRQSP